MRNGSRENSRTSQSVQAMRLRSQQEACSAVISSLAELKALNEHYNSGNHLSARTIAQTLLRLIDEELTKVCKRRELSLASFCVPPSPENLFPHIGFFVFGKADGDAINEIQDTWFLPAFRGPNAKRILRFSKWLSEPIFLEGAGGASHRIPLKKCEQVPFAKRRNISRNTLLKKVRNEVGAHFLRHESEDFAFSWTGHRLVQLECEWPSGNVWSTQEHPDKCELSTA